MGSGLQRRQARPLVAGLELLYLATQQCDARSSAENNQMAVTSGRPLSPHLSVYRWYLTMALSIAHRATGVALSAGLVLITWWLMALASGADGYNLVQSVLHSFFGQLVLFLWTFVLFFHGANGVRHLFWDAGYGFDKHVAQRSGMAVVGAAAGLTLVVWIISFIVA